MAEVKNYKRKPTVVQAIQFTGSNFDDIENFCNQKIDENAIFTIIDPVRGNRIGISIDTNEGKVRLEAGDYLIRSVDGTVYPCYQEIFSLTYEETDLPFKIEIDFAKRLPSNSKNIMENSNEEN